MLFKRFQRGGQKNNDSVENRVARCEDTPTARFASQLSHWIRFRTQFKQRTSEFTGFPSVAVGVSGWQEQAACERIEEASFSLPTVPRVWHSHLLSLICVCGYAFCERLNPLLSNDAFMLSVSSSPFSVSAAIPLSSNKENGAMCIRHQTTSKPTYCLPPMRSLLHALARLFSFFFLAYALPVCRRCLMWSIGVHLCVYTLRHCPPPNRQINPQVIIASGFSTLSWHQYTVGNEENPSRGLGWHLGIF